MTYNIRKVRKVVTPVQRYRIRQINGKRTIFEPVSNRFFWGRCYGGIPLK